MPASYRFVVSGRVQGVGFRWSAASQARRLGISGWIRNRPDGSVEGVASGSSEAVDQMRAWLQRGPPGASVSEVEWSLDTEPPEADGFTIRR